MSTANRERRSNILIRLIKTIVCFIAFEAVKVLIILLTLFQYGYLLINRKHSENVRAFHNRLALYAYVILRYAGLAEDRQPFPFGPFPPSRECEPMNHDPSFD